MANYRNFEEYRAEVLTKLGVDYTVEDLRNFEKWRLKVLEGLANLYEAEYYEPKIQEAVDGWLDDHPEATTTVEDDAVTTAKLYNGAVTTDKVADGAITDAKLASNGIKAEVADLKSDLSFKGDIINQLGSPIEKLGLASFPFGAKAIAYYSNGSASANSFWIENIVVKKGYVYKLDSYATYKTYLFKWNGSAWVDYQGRWLTADYTFTEDATVACVIRKQNNANLTDNDITTIIGLVKIDNSVDSNTVLNQLTTLDNNIDDILLKAFRIATTDGIIENAVKENFVDVKVSNTEETQVPLYLYSNLWRKGEAYTYFTSADGTYGMITTGSVLSISTADSSPFQFTKLSFLDNNGVEMDYYTLGGAYGFKRENLHPNLPRPVWALKIEGGGSITQELQISLGEKALPYADYVAPQVCNVNVENDTGWENLLIKGTKMHLYSPSGCDIEAKYITYKEESKGEFDGLKYVSCGDSFTAGGVNETANNNATTDYYDYKSGRFKTYPWWIAERTGMNLVNLGHSGDTMADFMNIYQNIPTDADYITIAYGLNDYSQEIPIGTIDDTSSDQTFLGYWNTALTWLLANIPFAHIGVIIMPAYMGNEYRFAIESVCEKYGIPYLNLYTNAYAPMFMGKDGADSTIAQSRTEVMRISATDLHPNVKAHKFFSTCVEGFLKMI